MGHVCALPPASVCTVGPPHTGPRPLLLSPLPPESWASTAGSLPAGSPTTPRPTAFLSPYFFRGDKRLRTLERSTPASVSSRLPGPLIRAGMFSASKQREVHLAGPADGAHAARAQVPPPSPGARVMVGVAYPRPCVAEVGVGLASGGWALAPSGRGHWGLASRHVGAGGRGLFERPPGRRGQGWLMPVSGSNRSW